MKCPKCGYLGFETTDRCRNCQYDFSLAPVRSDPDLALQTEHRVEGNAEFDLPPLNKPTDSLSDNALDLDRLFGELVGERAPATNEFRTSDGDSPMVTLTEDAAPMAIEEPPPAVTQAAGEPEGALPFDDSPIVPPPAAKPPLAVRRSTPELPRHRRRVPRPERLESLSFEPEPQGNAVSESVADTMALLMEAPALGVRIGAGVIDLIFLIAIDIVVLYLTLRISGLQTTLEDLRVLPPIPFAGFLAMLAFGYVSAFTVAGGQTIGKMVMSLRVVGDDGRPVDAAGGMLRAVGCMLVPITFGLSYVPALVTSDHRALHDRLAGTRVVRE
jgi:uncharacterized RDD family membrane protein YckC